MFDTWRLGFRVCAIRWPDASRLRKPFNFHWKNLLMPESERTEDGEEQGIPVMVDDL